MSTFKLLSAELWHRKTNVTLSLLALVAAATLFVASPTLLRGYQRESDQRLAAMQQETDQQLAALQQETDQQLVTMQGKATEALASLDKDTKRAMRDLGFNLRIVHANTDLDELFANFISFDMPEEYVQQLADSPEITKIVHLVASLKQRVEWEDKPRLLIGIAPEATQSHIEKKKPMGLVVAPGKVVLGSVAAGDRKIGDKVDIFGKEFEVEQVLPPHGRAEEDIAIFLDLKDAQEVLDKPGLISEILALGCKCKTIDRVEEITQQLEVVLPDTKVMEARIPADARERQRNLVTRHHEQLIADYEANREQLIADYEANREQIVAHEESQRIKMTKLLASVSSVVTPLIILVCAIWVGLLAWSNVRERRAEIGLLRAIGKRSGSIAALFLGKAIFLGFAAGVVGCLLGYGFAMWLATGVFDVAVDNFTPSTLASACAIFGTPLIAAMASYLPTLAAVNQDPAVVLSGD